jgi:hypothetical protein
MRQATMKYADVTREVERWERLGGLSTVVRIAQEQPEPPRTFKAFRSGRAACAFVLKCDDAREASMRKVNYGHGVTRYVVNYLGSGRSWWKRSAGRCEAARVIMLNGHVLNRRLPVPIS